MKSLTKAVEDLVAELDADADKPRWGLHGHKVVDDDYFLALDYAAERLRAILAAHAPPEQAATTPAPTLPPLPPEDVYPFDSDVEGIIENAWYEQSIRAWGRKCYEAGAAAERERRHT